MKDSIQELMKRNNLVLYEYEDDVYSNVNEKYIKYDGRFAEYRVDVDGINSGFATLTDAREFRDRILKEKGVVLIERD